MWHRAKPRTLLPLSVFVVGCICFRFFYRKIFPFAPQQFWVSKINSTSTSTWCTVDRTVVEDQEVLPGMPDLKTAVPVLAADHPDKDDVILRPHPGLPPTNPSLKTFGRFHHIGRLPQTCWTTTQCMACHSLAELSVPVRPGHWE